MQNTSDSDDIAERGQDVWLSWRPDHSLALLTDRSADDPSRAEAVS